MTDILMVVISFVVLFALLRFKVIFGIAMIITATLLTLLTGGGVTGVWDMLYTTVTTTSNLETVAAVFTIGTMGGLCGKYGILQKVVDNLGAVIPSRKALAMLIPAMIGMIPMPGGAVMSVPFIDQLGTQMKLTNSRKAAINLVFRHAPMLLMPYSTSMLMIPALFPEFTVYTIMPLTAIFVVGMMSIGYLCFLFKLPVEKIEGDKPTFKTVVDLLLYSSPLYICIILNVGFGIPIYLGVLLSLVVIFFLAGTGQPATVTAGGGEAKPLPGKKDYPKMLIKSLNWNVLLTVLGVFTLQSSIRGLDGLMQIFQTASDSSPLTAIIILACGGFFFAAITGMNLTSLGIVLPIVASMTLTFNQQLVFIYIVFITGYVGYYFSPLHLCQVFTLNYLKTTTAEVYREYKYYAVTLIGFSIVSIFALYALLVGF